MAAYLAKFFHKDPIRFRSIFSGFFNVLPHLRIGLGNQRPWLSESKTEMAKPALTLSYPKLNAKLLVNEMGKQFAIP